MIAPASLRAAGERASRVSGPGDTVSSVRAERHAGARPCGVPHSGRERDFHDARIGRYWALTLAVGGTYRV